MKRKVNEGFDHFQQFGACRCDQEVVNSALNPNRRVSATHTHHWLRHPVVQGFSEHARLPRLLSSDAAIGSRAVMMSRDNYHGYHCTRICRLRTVPASLPSETRLLTPCSDTYSWTPPPPSRSSLSHPILPCVSVSLPFASTVWHTAGRFQTGRHHVCGARLVRCCCSSEGARGPLGAPSQCLEVPAISTSNFAHIW